MSQEKINSRAGLIILVVGVALLGFLYDDIADAIRYGGGIPRELSDISVTEPGQDVLSGYGRFSGRWDGVWNRNLENRIYEVPARLIVKKIDSDGKVEVAYGWGGSKHFQFDAGLLETTGSIRDGGLRIDASDIGATLAFFPDPESSTNLVGNFRTETVSATGIFTKAP